MADDYLNFYTHKERYEQQLKTVEEQQQMNPEEMLNNLSDQKYFAQQFAGDSYHVHYQNKEDFEEGQQVLVSDDALVQYYEKTDPTMLEGLKSKSSIDVCGKKSEKKKLRKKYLEARSENEMEQIAAKKYRDTEVARYKEDGRWGMGFRPALEVDEAKEDLKKKETDEIMSYFQTTGKSKEELTKIREKVSKLGYLRRQQLRTLAGKSMPMDADLSGVDNELVKEKQTEYVKKENKDATWETYRIQRDAREFEKNHPLPDDTMQKVEKYNKHSQKRKISKTELNRAATAFMKEVKYTIKDGKKVPASPQYEENLKFNEKFLDSLLSDNEDDWDFRFKEIEKCIDECWDEYLPLVKSYKEGTFDYKTAKFDPMKLFDHSRKMLCVSGLNKVDTSFFKSKYAKEKISKERRDELEAKNDILSSFIRIMESKLYDIGIDPTGMVIQKEGEHKILTKDQLPANKMVVDMFLDKHKGFV